MQDDQNFKVIPSYIESSSSLGYMITDLKKKKRHNVIIISNKSERCRLHANEKHESSWGWLFLVIISKQR